MVDSSSERWNRARLKLENIFYPEKIYLHYWQSHDELIQKWFGLKRKDNLVILKTDMFEESKSKYFFSYEYSKKHKIIGIDISKVVLSKVKKNRNLNLVVADVNYLPFKERSFDLIISLSTLDHVDDSVFRSTVKRLESILNNRGRIFLTLDNRHNVIYFLEFFFWKYLFHIYDRYACYKISHVKNILEKTKLRIVDTDAVMFFPPFIDKILIIINLISPKLEPLTNKISDVLVKLVERLMNDAESRIPFGRFLSFKIEKM